MRLPAAKDLRPTIMDEVQNTRIIHSQSTSGGCQQHRYSSLAVTYINRWAEYDPLEIWRAVSKCMEMAVQVRVCGTSSLAIARRQADTHVHEVIRIRGINGLLNSTGGREGAWRAQLPSPWPHQPARNNGGVAQGHRGASIQRNRLDGHAHKVWHSWCCVACVYA